MLLLAQFSIKTLEYPEQDKSYGKKNCSLQAFLFQNAAVWDSGLFLQVLVLSWKQGKALQYGVVSAVDSKVNIHYIRTHWTGGKVFSKTSNQRSDFTRSIDPCDQQKAKLLI